MQKYIISICIVAITFNASAMLSTLARQSANVRVITLTQAARLIGTGNTQEDVLKQLEEMREKQKTSRLFTKGYTVVTGGSFTCYGLIKMNALEGSSFALWLTEPISLGVGAGASFALITSALALAHHQRKEKKLLAQFEPRP